LHASAHHTASWAILQVQPFASLVRRPPEGTPRFLINRQKVGLNLGLDFDSADTTDGCFIGDCDAGAQRLATLLGWGDLGGTSRTISGHLGRISSDFGGPASASPAPTAAPDAAPTAAPDAAPATNELAERLGASSCDLDVSSCDLDVSSCDLDVSSCDLGALSLSVGEGGGKGLVSL
jgi:hypothetical protein